MIFPFALAGVLLLPFFDGRLTRMNQRNHLFSYDYAKNVMRSVAPGGTLTAKKDVQLYALWHYQKVQGWRRDIKVVAQGLAGSSWYQQDKRRVEPQLYVGPLRDFAGWKRFIGLNVSVFSTMDCEVPLENLQESHPRGLVNAWGPRALDAAQAEALWQLMWRRGSYSYEEQPDFFTSDLIGNYAQARYQQGRQWHAASSFDKAAQAFLQAWSWQWSFPEPANFLGFMAFGRGDMAQARLYYGMAVELIEAAVLLSQSYHSLPDLKSSLRRSASDALMQLGVVCEKLKDYEMAESYYQRSLAYYASAQTHYNLAVLFWNRDWARVENELSAALRLDPRHADAHRYLAVLRQRSRR